MEESVIKFSISDSIATIVLNRPHVHNALNFEITDCLLKILQTLQLDPSVRMVILQASGKNFCAGVDLNWIKQPTTKPQSKHNSMALKLANLLNNLYHLDKPTIGLVQGAVYGGGIGLVSCCDIVLATPESQFCFSEVRLGLIPAIISPYVLNAIGTRAARRYLLSAEKFSAEKAFELGLVHEVVDQKQFQSQTNKFSEHFMLAGPNALARTKQLINDVTHCNIDNTIKYNTARWLTETQSSPEAREGITAFLENRPPPWINTNQD